MDASLRQKCRTLFCSHVGDSAACELVAPVALGWKLEQADVPLRDVVEMYKRTVSGDLAFTPGRPTPRLSLTLRGLLIEYRKVLHEGRDEFEEPRPGQIGPAASP